MHYHNNGLFFLLLLKKYNNDRGGAQHIILASHHCASNARHSIVFDAIIMTPSERRAHRYYIRKARLKLISNKNPLLRVSPRTAKARSYSQSAFFSAARTLYYSTPQGFIVKSEFYLLTSRCKHLFGIQRPRRHPTPVPTRMAAAAATF
jgi:hypothetical protein